MLAYSPLLALTAAALVVLPLRDAAGVTFEAVELKRLRKRHNAGEPFPLYKSRLPGTRPRKV